MRKYSTLLSSQKGFVIVFIVIVFLLMIFPFFGFAQYSLSTTTYSQTFDGLGVATNNTVTGGDLSQINTSLTGWYFYETGANANSIITRGTGSSSTGDTYNFGVSTNTDRSLGGLQTGPLNPYYGFYFTNNTGSTITSLTINYTGETWRVGAAGRSDEIYFQYSYDATALSNGTWTQNNSLSYQNTPSATAPLSGSVQQSAAISSTLSGLNIINGTTFFIRWTDFDAVGSDDGMAINNFSFTATNTGASPTVSISSLNPTGVNISTGSVNNIIAIVKLLATNTTITSTQAIFSTAGIYTGGSDISTIKVYQNTVSDLSGSPTQIFSGTVNTGANFTANSSVNISTGSTSYLIITADVGSNPATGSTISIAATPLANFTFSGSPTKTGGATAGNTFTINSSYFTAGQLAVLRVGDGSTALGSGAAQVQILQFNTTVAGQAGSVNITLPIALNGSNRILTQSGSATSEGDMSLSGDGRYLTLVGYDAPPGTAKVASTGTSPYTNPNGVIGNIDALGNINTSTYLDRSASNKAYYQNNIRAACTTDGTGFWTSGTGGTFNGVLYVPNGATATTGTQLYSGSLNARTVAIFNNQLYYSTASAVSPGPNYGVYQLGTFGIAPPTTSGQPTPANIINDNTTVHTPQEYVIFDLDLVTPASYPTTTDRMVCYLVDEGSMTTGGLLKYYSSNGGSTWTFLGEIYGGVRAVTGTINCSGNIDLFIIFSSTGTTSTRAFDKLIKYTDAAGFSNTMTSSGLNFGTLGTITTLSTISNTSVFGFGGVCFTPVTDLVISTAVSIPAGTYRNITIKNGGTGTLAGDITVIGTVSIANGGTLDCGVYHLLKNDNFQSVFTLQTGGTVKTAETNGLAAATYTGSIQTCATRTYSTTANYEYEGSGSQITGDGLPATVNNLTVSNTSNTSLTNSIAITNNLTVSAGTNLTINGKTITVNGNIPLGSAGTFTGSTTSNLIINGSGALTRSLKFAGGTANMLNNFTLNRSGGALLGSDLTVNNITLLSAGALSLNNFTLTMDGTVSGSGTITGSANSSLIVGGSLGASMGTLNFTTGAQILNNFSLIRTGTNANALLGTSLDIENVCDLTNSAGSFTIGANTLTLNGSITGSGSLTGSGFSNLYVGGVYNTSLGILNFTNSFQLLNNLTINRFNGTVSNAATLGTNLTANQITLTKGILSTGYNLLTLPDYSQLSVPDGVPYSSSETAVANSFIATCDQYGNPINVANTTTALSGSYGFQINNIGNGGTTGDVYFPVAATFLNAGTGVLSPTPNRMLINNHSAADNFNVVVNYGDITNTPSARVNRIWYVHSANSSAGNAPDKTDMKLFFTERDYSSGNFPTIENEIEGGFDYTKIMFVERDYNPNDPNYLSYAQGSDVQSFPFGSNSGKEVYAQYSVGTSADVLGNKNGIYEFNRFSAITQTNLILPVTIINFKALLQSNIVLLNWTSVNEKNIDHYETQRSSNDIDFITIVNKTALNNNSYETNYSANDLQPMQGNNYYRIKVIGKDGSVSFTQIQLIIFSATVAQSVNIYPNPVTDHVFTIALNNLPSGQYSVKIIDALGRNILINNFNFDGSVSTQKIILSSSINSGEYYLKLIGANETILKKIIVE